MRLYEFDDTKPIVTKIVAATDQLKKDVDSGKAKDWKLDQLLDYFQRYDVILDPKDLYNMIKKDPLKQVISNIQGQDVVFKGQQQPTAPADQNKEVVAKMADQAAQNLQK